MKALTIYQPWASLTAAGCKLYETKPFYTSYRGQVAIHAAKKYIVDVLDGIYPLGIEPERRAFVAAVRDCLGMRDIRHGLPYGAIIATTELVACHKIGKFCHAPDEFGYWRSGQYWTPVRAQEALFGDWREGRFAWQWNNTKLLDKPIPCRGQQGLWEWNNA